MTTRRLEEFCTDRRPPAGTKAQHRGSHYTRFGRISIMGLRKNGRKRTNWSNSLTQTIEPMTRECLRFHFVCFISLSLFRLIAAKSGLALARLPGHGRAQRIKRDAKRTGCKYICTCRIRKSAVFQVAKLLWYSSHSLKGTPLQTL